MNSLRSSLNSIPGAVSNLISASTASSFMQIASFGQHQNAPNTTTANDDCSVDSSNSGPNHDKSWPIPATLVKEQWRLIFTSDANVRDLEASIAHCRDLVIHSEECSEERAWLVRHLVDLRYALKELQEYEASEANAGGVDGGSQPLPVTPLKIVVGHHFINYRSPNRRLGVGVASTQLCDHCTGIIWSVVQTSYICTDCQFVAHQKCVDSVVRVCAHVTVSQRRRPIESICPEIGLAAQRYKCAECGTLLNFTLPEGVMSCFGHKSKKEHHWVEPRLCDYNGLYYCPSCHWNDSAVIPARVVHNWDFAGRRVSRASLQELHLFQAKPLIKLEEENPKLFVFLEKLGTLKKLRRNLVFMRKYLVECRQAMESKLLDVQMNSHRHMLQSLDYYSLSDLEQAENGSLTELLSRVLNTFEEHIRGCPLCSARAYICEICSNDEVIYPFDDGCITCEQCKSIYHRVCMTRKNMNCPKCLRLRERRLRRRQRRTRWREAAKRVHEVAAIDGAAAATVEGAVAKLVAVYEAKAGRADGSESDSADGDYIDSDECDDAYDDV